ncbi:MAG: TetR/AcrR family transcriptional regulator [Myxococcota bacterium]
MARPRDPDLDDRILRCTRELLGEGGLAAVSLAEVARRAGVGRPTVYRRYADVDALAMAVLHADLEASFQEIMARGLRAPTAEGKLLESARHFFTYYARDREVSRALLQRSLFARPPWAEQFAVQTWAFLGWLADELASAEDLRPEVDRSLVAQAYFGFYLSVAIAGTTGMLPDVEAQIALLRPVLAQHLEGLLVRD